MNIDVMEKAYETRIKLITDCLCTHNIYYIQWNGYDSPDDDDDDDETLGKWSHNRLSGCEFNVWCCSVKEKYTEGVANLVHNTFSHFECEEVCRSHKNFWRFRFTPNVLFDFDLFVHMLHRYGSSSTVWNELTTNMVDCKLLVERQYSKFVKHIHDAIGLSVLEKIILDYLF